MTTAENGKKKSKEHGLLLPALIETSAEELEYGIQRFITELIVLNPGFDGKSMYLYINTPKWAFKHQKKNIF